MERELTLNTLAEGRRAAVRELLHSPEMNRRLRDIGLTDGTVVECLQKSPWGSPVAYLIRGAVIALRTEDCKKISITEVDGEDG